VFCAKAIAKTRGKTIAERAAIVAATKHGLFRLFDAAVVAKGMRPAMARPSLARKNLADTFILWKQMEADACFDLDRRGLQSKELADLRSGIFLAFPVDGTSRALANESIESDCCATPFSGKGR
jgi:hypothetical protein